MKAPNLLIYLLINPPDDAATDLFSQFYPDEAPYNYTSPCLEDLQQKVELVQTSEELGYDVQYFTELTPCYPDGSYGRVATTRNNT